VLTKDAVEKIYEEFLERQPLCPGEGEGNEGGQTFKKEGTFGFEGSWIGEGLFVEDLLDTVQQLSHGEPFFNVLHVCL
jgi:hypothetical protein